MSFLSQIRALKSPQHRLAWLVAIGVDAIQLIAMPAFAEGAISPADVALDVLAGYALTRLLGWHWAFFPAFLAELIPGMDLFPTWTAAVFYVTSQQEHPGEPEILPPGPAPARRN